MTPTFDRDLLKESLKDALVELFRERREEFRDLLEEIIEEIGLARAIKEGLESEFVPRERVAEALGSEP